MRDQKWSVLHSEEQKQGWVEKKVFYKGFTLTTNHMREFFSTDVF